MTMTLTEAQKKALDEVRIQAHMCKAMYSRPPTATSEGSSVNPLHSGTGFLWKLDGCFHV